MGLHDPVTDWASDFDHTDDAWVADPFPIWDELRETCPVAHSERYHGVWLPTRHEDIAEIAHDTKRFTSRQVIVSEYRAPLDMAPQGTAPPITSDPPYHQGARRMLLPAFSPQAVARLEPFTRQACQDLVDQLEGNDVVDAAEGYAQHIPVQVIAHMLGLPASDGDRFRGFVNVVLEGVDAAREDREAGIVEFFRYLKDLIEDRMRHPGDDLVSYLLDVDLDGEKVDPFWVTRMIGLLMIAGIDTTWSAIGASIWHLANVPDDRERLIAQPDLLPTAIEELLRSYAPVTMARLVREDFEFNGCAMKQDDFVLLPFPAANRDPAAFDRADEVILDREVNRHAAFGLGIHRCVGSHLARMELRVALEVWLDAFPDFSLADARAVRWSGGQVRGPRELPLKIETRSERY